MFIAVIDTETDGLHVAGSDVLQLAAYIVDTASWQAVYGFCEFLPMEDGKTVNAAENINHISVEEIKAKCVGSVPLFLEDLADLISECEVVIAHNASFDRKFVEKLFRRYGSELPAVPWVCSVHDLHFARQSVDEVTGRPTRKLEALISAYGIINKTPHRADGDANALVELLAAASSEVPVIESQIAAAISSPATKYQAVVSKERRNEAKNEGFRWDGEAKVWWKMLKENQLLELKKKVNFDIIPFVA